MAETRGKFIVIGCSLLTTLKPKAKAAIESEIKQLTGKALQELEAEGWYDTKVFNSVLQVAEKHYGEFIGGSAIKIIGRRVYQIIAKTEGFPDNLHTPLDWVRWEGQGFLAEHRGEDVVPRKFITADPGHVVVEALSPGYDCVLIEGVYEGILRMCHIKDFLVQQTRCVKKGDPVCEYDITWKMESSLCTK